MPTMKTLTIGGTTWDIEGGVTSVNGKTGEVTLDATDVGAATASDIQTAILSVLPTDTASGAIASFPDGYPAPVEALSVAINPVQSGSGDPSPDNVRPISGHSEAVVTRTGINAWDEETEAGYINPLNGQELADVGKIRMKNYMPVLPNTTYYKKTGLNTDGTSQAFWNVYFDADKNFLSYGNPGQGTFTTPANCYYIRSGFETAYGTTYKHDVSINYPSTDTTYHAHNIQSVTLSLGQTVYGGTLDMVGGELVVDRVMVDLGTLNWSQYSTQFYANISGAKIPSYGQVANALCSNYPVVAMSILSNVDKALAINDGQSRVNVVDSSYSDKDTFKTAMNGVQLVYELATPLTLTLTGQELQTILGQNNIWNNVSGDTTVTYRADIGLYIEKKTS